MTQIIDLTQGQEQKRELKKIELVYTIYKGTIKETNATPDEFEKVMLVDKADEFDIHDLIVCIGEDGVSHRYLGHWNDGVI
jgi:hypothetical protein